MPAAVVAWPKLPLIEPSAQKFALREGSEHAGQRLDLNGSPMGVPVPCAST